MKRIKSAQYMRMPAPKPFPEQLDPQYEIAKCKLCEEPKYADDLTHGFCEECLHSGTIERCSNCEDYIHEDEAIPTDDGPMCDSCAESLYDEGRYIGPRRTYYSGPAEWYD
jgi:formylmethanofuran dehydrogenase subunit E